MASPGGNNADGSKGGTDGLPPSTKATLSRPASRRTLRSYPSSSSTDNPLFGGSSEPSQPEQAGSYAVYNPLKKRASVLGAFSGPAAPSTSSPLSPSDGPLSSSSSSVSSPPFTPTTAPSIPPLVSRPSNSTLPATSGRQYARSVSEAKEQLQKQALKAELQGLGLAAESVGSAIVYKLANLGEEQEYRDVQAAIASGKTTLLLPAEKLDLASPISPTFLLDHLILLDPPTPSTSASPAAQGFATLGGLRGYMSTDELVFTSCGTAVGVWADAAALDLSKADVQRSLRGAASPPLPPQSSFYPSTMLISSITNLSVPQSRSSAPTAVSSASSRTNTTSRLAALFAKTPAPSANEGDDLPPVVSAPAGLLSGSESSTSEASDAAARKSGAIRELSVLAIGKAVKRVEVVAGIAAGVEAQLREASKSVPGVEGEAAVLDHLVSFATRFQPTPASAADSAGFPPSLFSADAETTSEAFQDLLHSARLDLTRNLGAAAPPSASLVDDPTNPSLQDFVQLEERVDASLEEVEGVLTGVLYDRLFAPPSTRDLREDANLCSRVAALNVLELDLEHLGLDLGDEEGLPGWERESRRPRECLEDLTGRIGKELDRLEDPLVRTPSAKLAILVQCHTLLVDGLGALPPVPLKKELSGEDRSSLSDKPVEVEMDDASSRASSLPPSRPRSPTPTAPQASGEEELLKTPKPPPAGDADVPELKLPDSTAASGELSSSLLEASTTSYFEPAAPSPPASVFESSRRTPSTGASSSTSSADLILPLLIYSVVRANPPHLVSHLNFVHRFRSESLLHGQSSYCFTNFSAVVEFLTNIDVEALGITSQKPLGGSPSPSPALGSSPSPSSLSPSFSRPRAHTTGGLIRNRFSSEVDSLVGTAGSALTGVVDSSYRLIFSGARGAAGVVGGVAPRSLEDVKSVLDGARGRARGSLPFRRSFSTRTLETPESTAAQAQADASSGHREMVDIAPTAPGGTPDVPADAYAPPPSATSAPPPLPPRPSSLTKRKDDSDARSVRSISSMLKDTSLMRTLGEVREGVTGGGSPASGAEERPSLGERLAGLPLPGLGRFSGTAAASPAGSRRSSLLNPATALPTSSSSASSATAMASPPGVQQRFLDVQSATELKVGELQDLLDGYKALARRLAELGAAEKDGKQEEDAAQA
ncbi:hypothetical protein JCM10213_001232 [Rhodosporidiobolus nylandii]